MTTYDTYNTIRFNKFKQENFAMLKQIYTRYIINLNRNISFDAFCYFAYEQSKQ